jgi:hypothetical protein
MKAESKDTPEKPNKPASKAGAKPKAPTAKVFDVAPPGKSMPSSSSKPVIVTNRTVVRDPMMTAPELEGDELLPTEELPKVSPSKKTKVVIKPLHDFETEEGTGKEPEEEKPASKITVKTEDTEAPESEAETKEPAATEEIPPKEATKSEPEPETAEPEKKPAESEAKTTEEVSDEAKPESKPEESEPEPTSEESEEEPEAKDKLEQELKNVEDKEAIKRREAAQALIDSKKYFVPINSVKKRRSKQLVILLLILILLAIGGLAALDAGLVDVGIKAPTDFISD